MVLLCLFGVALALAVQLAAAQPFNFSRGTGGWVDASFCGGVPSCIASLGCSQLDRGNSRAGWCGDDCLSDFNISVPAEEAEMFCCGEEFRCPAGSSGCCETDDDEFRCFDSQDSCDEKCAAPRGVLSCSTCGEGTGLVDCERGFFCLSQDKCGPLALGIVLLILSLLSLPCGCLGCWYCNKTEKRYDPPYFLSIGTTCAFGIALGVGISFLIAGLYLYAVLVFSLLIWMSVATCCCESIFGQNLSSFSADEFAEWLRRECKTRDGKVKLDGRVRLTYVGLTDDSMEQLAAGMLKVWGTSENDRGDVEEDDFPTLKEMSLYSNRFADDGLRALARALSFLPRCRETLELLSIGGNENITTLKPLADAGVLEGLKKLDVSYCSLSGDECVLPSELCANLPALEKLYLRGNMGGATVTLTAEALCALPAECKVWLRYSKAQMARPSAEDGKMGLVALPTDDGEEFGANDELNIKTVAEICAFAGVLECDWDPKISQELSTVTSSSDDCTSVESLSAVESLAISSSSSSSSDDTSSSELADGV